MSSVWYTGTADVRTISSASWTSVGAPGPTSTWDSSNGWSIPTTVFTSAQLTYLGTQSDFALAQPDGPRTGATPINVHQMAGYRGSIAPVDDTGFWIDDSVSTAPNLKVKGTTGWINADTTPDATATTKGKVQLAGDLGGTATAPTVPGKMAIPSGVTDGYLPIADAAQTFKFRWGTAQEVVAKALGWEIADDPKWSVSGSSAGPGINSTTSVLNAVHTLDKFNTATGTYTGGARGGTLWFRGGGSAWIYDKCIVISARIRIKGVNGVTAGGIATRFQAVSSGGDFTNHEGYVDPTLGTLGIDPGQSWMVRTSHNNPANPEWFHGGEFSDIQLDCNNVAGLGGIVTLAAGEASYINNVQVVNTGVVDRVVSCTFNGTNVVTAAAGAFDDQEDWMARVESATAFPAYTDFVRTDAVTTAGSAVITIPSGGVTTALIGAEATAGNSGFARTSYVVSVNVGANTVTMSDPLPADASAGTGKTLTLGQPRDFKIDQIDSATQIQLTRPVPFTGTGNMTIHRGRPGYRFYSYGATGRIGYINAVGNSGSGVEIVGSPPNSIEVIAGDNNGGALVRFHKTSTGGDPQTCRIGHIKSENNNYGDTTVKRFENYGDHDPVVAFTQCGMTNVEIQSANMYAGDQGSRFMVRTQQSGPWQSGFPSISIRGVEGVNPWNLGFDWRYYDRDSGHGRRGGSIFFPTFGGRFDTDTLVNKDTELLGGDLYLTGSPYNNFIGTVGEGGNLYADGKAVVQGVVSGLSGVVLGRAKVAGITVTSSTAAPSHSGALGDLHIRQQAPTFKQYFYLCTTAGSATTGAWTPYEQINMDKILPRRQTRFGYSSPDIMQQGVWNFAYSGNSLFTHIGYNSSSAQNDEARWYMQLQKGTYRFNLLADKFSDRAIQTWEMSFDGGTTWTGGTNGLAIGTFDCYNATQVFNTTFSVSGLVIPASGEIIVRVRAATRNASNTTGWITVVTQWELIRTS